MLQSLKIKGFRKYQDITIRNLNEVNIILGDNNVGKTSILEAVYGWACGQNILPFLYGPVTRERYAFIQNSYWLLEELLSVFHNRYDIPLNMSFEGIDENQTIIFNHMIYPSDLLTDYDTSYKSFSDKVIPRVNNNATAINDSTIYPGLRTAPPAIIARWEVEFEKQKETMNISLPQIEASKVKSFRAAKFIDVLSHTTVMENAQVYSSLKRERLMEEFIEEIKRVFPEIKGFDLLPYTDGSQAPVSIVRQDGSMLPMYVYGDGVQKWFYFLGLMTVYKNSILCIDEIDTGFHPEAQKGFAENLVRYAHKNNVQLFATTHNIEFVDNFLEAITDALPQLEDSVRIITLKNINGNAEMRSMNAKEARKVRELYNLELR